MEIINIIAALICCSRRRGAADVAQYHALPDQACLTFSCFSPTLLSLLSSLIDFSLTVTSYGSVPRQMWSISCATHLRSTYFYEVHTSEVPLYNLGQLSGVPNCTGPRVGTGSSLVIIV